MRQGQDRVRAGVAPQPQGDEDSQLRQAAFQRALRHSRRVRLLKTALPLAAVLIAAGFAAYSYIQLPGSVTFDISESAYANGKLVMANPKLDGFTKASRPYSMTAMRALQHVDQTGIVELEGIDAKLPINETNFAMIGADRGVYDRDKNTLDIPTAITVRTTDGMEVKLHSAYVDIEQGSLKTDKPVDIRMEGAKLAAESMSVLENGKVLIFERRVKMELRPDRLKSRQSGTIKIEKPSKDVQN